MGYQGRRLWDVHWDAVKLRTEVVSQILSSLAILVAGGWVLFTYVLTREGVWNLDLTVTPEVSDYGDSSSLVVLNVELVNRGRRRILAGDRGLRLWVEELPRSLPPGTFIARNGPTIEGAKPLIDDYAMLSHYRSTDEKRGRPYGLEPGSTSHETESVIVNKGATLLVCAAFFGQDGDSIAEYRYVSTAVGGQTGDPAAKKQIGQKMGP